MDLDKVDASRLRVLDPKGPSTGWLETMKDMAANHGVIFF